ncbi:DUF4185 domain-containing protein [Nocardia callitridis]|uniref:DUF4185 domain-containing protein n=1 Tax=Nocardia callitridis TaxID=648753 RepID=A0ABP9JXZ6_9NOCA
MTNRARHRKLLLPALFGVLLTNVPTLSTPLAHATQFPWAPPPVNSCGEIGYDPLNRAPDPSLPPPPPLPPAPPQIDIPYPVPEFTPVPIPDPPQDKTRVAQTPLPSDPCHNPCPDIRDNPKPKADPKPEDAPHGEDAPALEDAPSEEPEPDNGSSSGSSDTPDSGSSNGPDSGSSSGSSDGPDSGSSSGSSSGSGVPFLPRIQFNPEPEPIPIPVPGGPSDEPQPAPPPVVNPIEPGPQSAPVPPPGVRSVDLVDQVTGHGSNNRTDMRWQVDGTDLGLMWETEPGKVAVVFGDTFGAGSGVGGGGEDWRSNILAYSTDRELGDGLSLDTFVQDSRCHATEILGSRKIKNWETTTIPTSGFAIGDRQYLSYMSVNRWSRVPGMWWTNYGGLAYSDDGGSTWTKDQHARWENFFGLGKFQVSAMVPRGDYVYMFGTPNGRVGMIGLARVAKADVLNKSAYQYWVDGNWAPAAENNASPLVLGPASELSVRYDEANNQWQMVYLDVSTNKIVVRNAASPQGRWTDGVQLVSTDDYPKTYGGFIHPWSTGKDLYFTISEWDSYNVYLMHAQLDSPN